MSRYTNNIVAGRNHPYGRLLPPTCGGCGKPIRRSGHEQIGYLCRNCAPRPRINELETFCEKCKFYPDCSTRVSIGAWVRCETPDMLDLRRLLDNGGMDETVRRVLEEALTARVDRVVLENAITKAAEQVYQKGRYKTE